MPTDEDDQDGHFFFIFNHLETGATSPPSRVQPLFLLLKSTPQLLGGWGGGKNIGLDQCVDMVGTPRGCWHLRRAASVSIEP